MAPQLPPRFLPPMETRMDESNKILSNPAISPRAIRYHLLTMSLALLCTVAGVVLIPLMLPIMRWYYSRYFKTLNVVLTTRELQVDRGIWNREEKSIPLEKITDLAAFQGPVMRCMNLKGLRVETAGQSGSGGALVRLIGLEDTEAFRTLALRQRDRVTDASAPAPAAEGDAATPLLTEIRDTLIRIEQRLGEPTKP